MTSKVFLTFIFALLLSCNKSDDVHKGLKWLSGDENNKFKVIEKQFRGFDKTMMEVGYRYNGLYWAGEDKNWELASYHIEKIKHAIDLGVERRPKRKENAQVIYPILDELEIFAKNKDQKGFREQFEVVRQTCNACHQAEQVSYFNVLNPKVRVSPLGENQ